MKQRHLLRLVLTGMFVTMIAGCGEDEGPEKPQNTAPSACFAATPAGGTIQRVFQVDASCSSDEQDSVGSLQVRWDWENDGIWDTAYSTTKTAEHQYGAAGTRTIKLDVKDTGGLTAAATRTVTIAAVPPPPEGFVLVQPGTFAMGSLPEDLCRESIETQHQVTLTRAFQVSTTEVTQAEWQATMGWNESAFAGADRPVENITWFDAVAYCNERSMDEGFSPPYSMTGVWHEGNHVIGGEVSWIQGTTGYRLLTEAEWEYACRAGSTGAFCNGGIGQCDCGDEANLAQVGWYCGNSGDETHDVGTGSPNAWGIYAMHGNVWEWCWDWYWLYGGSTTDPTGPRLGSRRMLRGGGWGSGARNCRSAYRFPSTPDYRASSVGLRLARTEWWGETPPTACFIVDPDSGTTATIFQFDASCCTDGLDPVSALEVRWDWENDGTWDTEYSTTTAADHQYAMIGVKTVKLEVKDTAGLTAATTRTVVLPPPGGFVLAQPGTFAMGSPSDEPWRSEEETQHQVTLTRAFHVSETEVTQEQWQQVMGWNDSGHSGAYLPVQEITWYDAVSYCNERSLDEGLQPAYTISGATYSGNHMTAAEVTWDQGANGYRLLTEAEWEYACRAGSAAAFCNGGISQRDCGREASLAQVGWYCGNTLGPHDVATKNPNAWGLYDMHGNVWEWCWDRWRLYGGSETDPTGPASGSDRVFRGGSWNSASPSCRSACRAAESVDYRAANLGLRLAKTAP